MPAAIERTVLISSSPASRPRAERAACWARGGRSHRGLRVRQERLARGGQPNRAREPLEQLAPDLLLEQPHLLRQRGLGDVHAKQRRA